MGMGRELGGMGKGRVDMDRYRVGMGRDRVGVTRRRRRGMAREAPLPDTVSRGRDMARYQRGMAGRQRDMAGRQRELREVRRDSVSLRRDMVSRLAAMGSPRRCRPDQVQANRPSRTRDSRRMVGLLVRVTVRHRRSSSPG
jgi:hypothetical protein